MGGGFVLVKMKSNFNQHNNYSYVEFARKLLSYCQYDEHDFLQKYVLKTNKRTCGRRQMRDMKRVNYPKTFFLFYTFS